jgi:hypothetical protein
VLSDLALMHLFAIDDYVRRGADSEADLVAAEADHGNDHTATDAQRFIGAAA